MYVLVSDTENLEKESIWKTYENTFVLFLYCSESVFIYLMKKLLTFTLINIVKKNLTINFKESL